MIDLIERLSKAGGFEDTLSYIRIPVLKVTKMKAKIPQSDRNEHTKDFPLQHEDHPTERTDLIKVFDKLASKNVRRILSLFVEDGGGFSHSDAAIERAIRGKCSIAIEGDSERPSALEVEYWYATAAMITRDFLDMFHDLVTDTGPFYLCRDWKKPDLSLDTIAFAAPNVKWVNLYWSGNWTVLRGWCCPGRFEPMPNQESELDLKFDSEFKPTPMMEKIHLHAFAVS